MNPQYSTPPQRATSSSNGERVEQVLALAARGWHVFPLRPDDKRPAVAQWEQRATTDRERITTAWSAGPYGVGIACGPSGLVVVDLDTAKGEEPPAEWAQPGVTDGADVLAVLYEQHGEPFPFGCSPVALTGSGGMHLYYRAPAGREVRNSAGRLGWKVDVRAHGGYVVAPPSVAAGRPYRWAGSLEAGLSTLPAWLAELAAPAEPTVPVLRPAFSLRLRDARGYGMTALRNEVETVLRAQPGTRNDTLHRSAFSLGTLVGDGRLNPYAVTEALGEAARLIGLGTGETDKTIASGLRAGAQHPRKAAA
ncbi:bifunctional DNA primase/polymerase [Streptomyces yunnanensis]|uniref:Bifunctional DNA primase/polymerase, N-terminal n=1 Tax=Streptomyces yunnanensis TaxID=156453 RepID=A0A9X8N0Q2_9ACTN|nr:bifunctional DNA primase/polymerase [Streptomyces yunnanensis]SHM56935.1 Bifunctional DNA primase/polymerase, N-terminal [Streptomyces yunnanensis]